MELLVADEIVQKKMSANGSNIHRGRSQFFFFGLSSNTSLHISIIFIYISNLLLSLYVSKVKNQILTQAIGF